MEGILMYYQNFYGDQTQEEIAASISAEGFDPLHFTNNPGDSYPPHRHPETKLLAFLKGSMDVTVGGVIYHCEPGDKMIIDSNVQHSALVGSDGCEFYWSEKLLPATASPI